MFSINRSQPTSLHLYYFHCMIKKNNKMCFPMICVLSKFTDTWPRTLEGVSFTKLMCSSIMNVFLLFSSDKVLSLRPSKYKICWSSSFTNAWDDRVILAFILSCWNLFLSTTLHTSHCEIMFASCNATLSMQRLLQKRHIWFRNAKNVQYLATAGNFVSAGVRMMSSLLWDQISMIDAAAEKHNASELRRSWSIKAGSKKVEFPFFFFLIQHSCSIFAFWKLFF